MQGFNEIRTHGLCVGAAVLYQMKSQDPYFTSRPIPLSDHSSKTPTFSQSKPYSTNLKKKMCQNFSEKGQPTVRIT